MDTKTAKAIAMLIVGSDDKIRAGLRLIGLEGANVDVRADDARESCTALIGGERQVVGGAESVIGSGILCGIVAAIDCRTRPG